MYAADISGTSHVTLRGLGIHYSRGNGAENAFLGAVFTQKRSIYQDRLGTDIDIGKR